MTRVIVGLKWARELEKKPSCIPTSRARGAKALGVRYERAFAKAILHAEHGKWFEFEDRNGHGYCQIDFIFQHKALMAPTILEVKYTWTEEGHRQMENLYVPVLTLARRLSARPGTVLVCKAVTKETGRFVEAVYGDLQTAVLCAEGARRVAFSMASGDALRGCFRPP